MFSVVIPVYNEEAIFEQNAKKLMKFLDSLEKKYEVVICSNGSSDRTDEIGRRLADNVKLKFLTIPQRGVGSAFKAMVAAASCDYVISLDMDLTTDLSFVPACLKLLKDNDMVLGSKKVGKQNRSFFRKLISDAFIRLTGILLGLGYTDYSIGVKGYRKSVIVPYLPKIDRGSSYVIELIYFAKKNGCRIAEVPVHCDDMRKSKFNIVHEIFYRLKNLLKLWLREKIIK